MKNIYSIMMGLLCLILFSNPIIACENFTDGGQINSSGNLVSESPFDPWSINNAESPSGGSGGTAEYQWQKNEEGGGWIDIAGATNKSYNPPLVEVSTCFRRSARIDCQNDYVFSNEVCIEIINCQNVTSAGSFSFSGSLSSNSAPYDPWNINNQVSASGGSDESIDYQWESQEEGGSWEAIAGATNKSYNPPPLDISTCFRRGAKIECADEYVYTDEICFTIIDCNDFESGGSIKFSGNTVTYNETINPWNINNDVSANGGNGGEAIYQWEKKTETEDWSPIDGADDPSYDPPTLSETTCYRRAARRSCSDEDWVYSNEICFLILVCENFTNPGTIVYTGNTSTNDFELDPFTIVNENFPSGGEGGDVDFQWQKKKDGGNWTNIGGATSNSYNPPSFSENTCFRRGAKRDCLDDWIYTVSICFNVNGVACENYNSGGEITFSGATSTTQPTYNPWSINSSGYPSGGTGGTLEFKWQTSTDDTDWVFINNADGSSYNPPEFSENRCFRRAARRNCQNDWVYSNEICFTVTPIGGEDCDNYTDAGEITYSGATNSTTGSIDPFTISSDGFPSGGSGGTLEFKWQTKTDDTDWVFVNNATSSSYNPPELTENHCFRRGAKRSTCLNEWVFTDEICFTVNNGGGEECNNYTDAGEITYSGTTNSTTGTLDPFTISSEGFPSGGNGGTLEFKWQTQTDDTDWVFLNTATSSSYNPPAFTENRCFRRGAKRNTCANEWVFTDEICFTVSGGNTGGGGGSGNCENFDEAGSISYSGTFSTNNGSIDPWSLASDSYPSGGEGGSTEFQWQQKIGNGNWADVSGATGNAYNPPSFTQNTCFRRATRRDCQNDWLYSNELCFSVNGTGGGGGNGCENFDDGGTISYSGSTNSSSTTIDPWSIVNNTAPSGGSGLSSYQWQKSENGGDYTDISGATSSNSFNPTTFSVNTCFRRAAQKDCQNEWVYSNEICFTVQGGGSGGGGGNGCENVTSAGTIKYSGSTNSSSNSIDPWSIVNDTDPTGGSGGSVEYQWQEKIGTGNWTDVNGATSKNTYNPPVMNDNTCVRRAARMDCQNEWEYSNEICFTVQGGSGGGGGNGCENVTSAGTIKYSGSTNSSSNSIDPWSIVNDTDPNGGSGGNIEYQWQEKVGSGNWTDVSGATSKNTYDPPIMNNNTCVRRAARMDCQNEWEYSNEICFTVQGGSGGGGGNNGGDCENYNDAGTISYSGSTSSSGSTIDPWSLTNSSLPSGGEGGSAEYKWQQKILNGSWTDISGANSAYSYNPNVLAANTCFRRGARRSCQSDWVYSNEICFAVNTNANKLNITESTNIYPNPTNNNTTLTFTPTTTENIVVEIYDMGGRMVARVFEGEIQANTTLNLNIEAQFLQSGFNVVQIRGVDTFEVVKVVKR